MINNKFEHIAGIINLRFVNLNNQILLKNIASIVAASNGSACSNLNPQEYFKQWDLIKRRYQNLSDYLYLTMKSWNH